MGVGMLVTVSLSLCVGRGVGFFVVFGVLASICPVVADVCQPTSVFNGARRARARIVVRARPERLNDVIVTRNKRSRREATANAFARGKIDSPPRRRAARAPAGPGPGTGAWLERGSRGKRCVRGCVPIRWPLERSASNAVSWSSSSNHKNSVGTTGSSPPPDSVASSCHQAGHPRAL